MASSSSCFAVWSTLLFLVVLFGWHEEVAGQCLEHQKSLLVKLNQSLTLFNNGVGYRGRIFEWDSNKDCCDWSGVACNYKGYVIGLDLSYEGIIQGLNNSSPLFDLQHLTALNLAGDEFQLRSDMSSGFERLVNLKNLNTSYSYLFGRFPAEISNLTSLVTLDLSYSIYYGMYESPFDFRMLFGNLTQLSELHLDNVNYMGLGMQGSEWSKVMSSSLPHLQVLSLKGCGLSGLIDASFQNLTFLSVLDLSENDFKVPFPIVFSKFKYLTSLRLAGCGFLGEIPDSLGDLKMLSILDLGRCNLEGNIPSSLINLTSLTYLNLSWNGNLNGNIPVSLSKLTLLSSLDLSANSFEGLIPEGISEVKSLSYLDLSANILSGPVPSFSKNINLTNLALGVNQLTGSILNTNWGDLTQLKHLDIQYNFLTGSIPSSLFGIPALVWLDLSRNHFVNFTNEPVSTPLSQLKTVILSRNDLQGPFPSVIFGLQALQILQLGFNSFSGTFYMDSLQQLRNLSYLGISYNNFSVEFGEDLQPFPNLTWLKLASCKLEAFPQFLNSHTKREFLDLSANLIQGEIPGWIWDILGLHSYLNLSHNHLQTFEEQIYDLRYCEAVVIDLSHNNLHGNIPLFRNPWHLDLSRNSFDSMVFSTLNISSILSLRISNNFLRGSIPKSLCNAKLYTLDLSNNFLSGILPPCLLQIESLRLLNLKNNSIGGSIPNSLPLNCTLEILILNSNTFKGNIPTSLEKCKILKLLDLGNNKLLGRLPYWMSNNSSLLVLVLRSNMFQGSVICPGVNVIWPSLQILDIASNNFSGNLPSRQLLSWKAMLVNDSTSQHNISRHYIGGTYERSRYEVIVPVVLKGTAVALTKILVSFALIDLSDNMFEGTIPVELGYFTALRQLNISYNNLRGQIPSSLGRMQNLESLDLQNNELSGTIPPQLANLNFLSVLNLSFNQLEGNIPNGGQFQTFSEYSFLHNEGLCGLPLDTRCRKKDEEGTKLSKPSSIFEGEVLISAEVGYAVGFGLIIMPLIFWPGWRMRLYEFTDRILLKMFCR